MSADKTKPPARAQPAARMSAITTATTQQSGISMRGNRPEPAEQVARLLVYHTTRPEAAVAIMAEGFEDRASAWSYIPDFKGGMVATGWHSPGVWVSDKPPLLCISFDQYSPEHTAWIEVSIDPTRPVRAEEWEQEAWPLRQWLCSAADLNCHPRRLLTVAEVIALRHDKLDEIRECYLEAREVWGTDEQHREWDAALGVAPIERRAS